MGEVRERFAVRPGRGFGIRYGDGGLSAASRAPFVVVPHLVHALELGGAIIPSMKLAPQPAKRHKGGKQAGNDESLGTQREQMHRRTLGQFR